MILFDPGVEGGGGSGGGDAIGGSGSAVAEAPAATGSGSSGESVESGGAAPEDGAPAAAAPAGESQAPAFRPSIIQWAKDRGYSEEEISEFKTERALVRALGNLPEQPAQQPVAQVAKQVEAPKAQPAPVKEAPQADEIDVSKIPDLQDGPDGYDGPIVAAFNGMKKIIMQMQQREKDRDRQHFESQMFPVYEAADEFFDSQADFADVFGKGVQAAGTPTQQERVKVFEMAQKLSQLENKPITTKNIKTMLERAQILVHKDRVFAAKKAEGKEEVKKAVTQRRQQYIARPSAVRTVPGDAPTQAPAGPSAFDKFSKRAEAAGIKN